MRRPGFGATILLVIVLTVVGLGVRAWRPFMPPPSRNRLSAESAPFLTQGEYQQIDWLPMGPSALAAARKGGKPILLVVGTPWSRVGRLVDEALFTDRDIQAFLRSSFVCVRVDATAQPEWLSAYLPFSRAGMGMIPDFQIWFLAPNGDPYDAILTQSPKEVLDYDAFRKRLIGARDTLKQILEGDYDEAHPPPVPGESQRRDLNMLKTSGRLGLAVADFTAAVLPFVHPAFGGFPNFAKDGGPAYQRLLPNALRYLLTTGRLDDFKRAADPALRSPIVDWLEGGFFIRSQSLDWMRPEYDKTAVQNAELMQVFALAGVVCHEPRYTEIAKATFDCLAGPFMADHWVQACRVGDERRGGRSEHSGFPVRVLREALSGIEVQTSRGVQENAYRWARENLGLRVEDNPWMLVRMPDPRLPEREPKGLATVLTALRSSAEERPETYAGPALTEVNGIVAARMIWVARLWNDSDRMRVAQSLFEKLGKAVVAADVAHSLDPAPATGAYLGDYLAYADAALQNYLATDSQDSFEVGLRVLSKAQTLFRHKGTGEWDVVPYREMSERELIGGPQIVDDDGESCTARVMRLTEAYGRLLHGARGTYGALGQSLEDDASAAEGLFLSMAPSLGPSVAGYFCAALSLIGEKNYSACAFVVGPHCRESADELFRRVPTHMVACCFGSVRPDLQRLPAGVYVLGRDEHPGKPLTLDQAIAKLNGVPNGPSVAHPTAPR